MALKGEVFRHQEGRLTQRILLDGKSYFIKQHHGVGWKEIFKNLFQLRLPILSARNEWRAIKKLQALKVGVPKVVGYGVRGLNPARLRSFILMEELTPTISLETLSQQWENHPPTFLEKYKLIEAIANIARVMHEHGVNHRDFYLCHFLLDQSPLHLPLYPLQVMLYLIDLHRANIRRSCKPRWVIKDLAGLLFSCAALQLTKRDLYRFIKTYRQKSLRELFSTEKSFWQKVLLRGTTYRDHTKPANQ